MRVIEKQVGGHITLLFSIHSDSHRLTRQGSRGAGFCVKEGVSVKLWSVEGDGGKPTLSCKVTDYCGKVISGNCKEQYEMLLKELEIVGLIPQDGQQIVLEVQLHLPVSQGFGMSAAGLLATGNALAEYYQFEDGHISSRVSHRVERRRSSGLGDILALDVGGVELRLEPGAPPEPGYAVSFPGECQAVLVWAQEENRHTKGYIDDENWKKMITIAGEEAVGRLSEGTWGSHRWQELLDEAEAFAKKSELLSESHRAELLESVKGTICELGVEDVVRPALCMLGTSVAILPCDLEHLPSEVRLLGLIDALVAQGYSASLTHLQ